ncbi:MATH and LRR domain-containing protein PFE0570w [Hydra vulgaris]|uniref:Serum response factor-binding protein 1 n=1 Tax=Hydra vulgaris TaxID=6087 RepID=A0ABM4CFW1_HYDVU
MDLEDKLNLFTKLNDSNSDNDDDDNGDDDDNADDDDNGDDDDYGNDNNENLNSIITENDKENENVLKNDSAEGIKKKPRVKKQKVIINKDKKIGPQKQKEVIRNLLKRSRIYQVRKLTRRIERLRSLKGTELQLEKHKRKIANYLKEIEAMKSLIIEQMAEKLVDVFKGICNDFCKDIWNAALSKSETEKKLQDLGSNLKSDSKFLEIAYLKIFSSKDVIDKLKLIENGQNLKKPHKKPRKLKRKPSKKHILKNNSNSMTPLGSSESALTSSKTLSTNSMESKITDLSKSKVPNKTVLIKKFIANDSKKSSIISNKNVLCNKVEEKLDVKTHQDSFFLNRPTTSLHDIDEEFNVAPVVFNSSATKVKRNRMGQRTRQKLYQGKLGVKAYNEKSGIINKKEKFAVKSYNRFKKGNDFKEPKTKHKDFKQSKRKINKNDDIESLHPSWQAKKKMKLNPVAFSGTRITFSD